MDLEDIRGNYILDNDLKSLKVAGLRTKIDEMPRLKELTRLKFKNIVENIRQANLNRKHAVKLDNIKDLEHISNKDLRIIV